MENFAGMRGLGGADAATLAALAAARQQQHQLPGGASGLMSVADLQTMAAAEQLLNSSHRPGGDNGLLFQGRGGAPASVLAQLSAARAGGVMGNPTQNPHLLSMLAQHQSPLGLQQELEMRLLQRQELELEQLRRAAALRGVGLNIPKAEASPSPAGVSLQQELLERQQLQQRTQQQQKQNIRGLPEEGSIGTQSSNPQELLRAAADENLTASNGTHLPGAAKTPDINGDDKLHQAEEAADPAGDPIVKTPGSLLVPCRARGMPMDHNFKTAYFIIPENVQHGEELVCSYFACRNAGIKFRYCIKCKVPVAKRYFRKRHRHGLTEGGAGVGGSDDEDGGVGSNDPNSVHDESDETESLQSGPKPKQSNGGHIPICGIATSSVAVPAISSSAPVILASSSIKSGNEDIISETGASDHVPSHLQENSANAEENIQQREVEHEADVAKSSVDASTSEPENYTQPAGEAAMGAPESVPDIVAPNRGDEQSPEGGASFSAADDRIDEKRARRWASLLRIRPSTADSDSMSTWLLEVLAVSDLDKPLREDPPGMFPPPKQDSVPQLEENLGVQKRKSEVLVNGSGVGGDSDASAAPAVGAAGAVAGTDSLPSFASLKKYKKPKNSSQPCEMEVSTGSRRGSDASCSAGVMDGNNDFKPRKKAKTSSPASLDRQK